MCIDMTPLLRLQQVDLKDVLNQREVNKSANTSPHYSSHCAFGRVHVAEIFFPKILS